MRQWHVKPKILCRKHLLGEHVEHHMFAASINKGTSIQGYIDNNLLAPLTLHNRHNAVVKEMKRRHYNHKSPLPKINFSNLTPEQRNAKVNKKAALADLIKRCKDCRANKRRLQK